MRVLYVWITAAICWFVLTIGWLVGSGVTTAIASQTLSDATGNALALVVLIEFVAAWWGPILDGVVLLWALINSQEVDPNSRIYG